MIYKTHGAIIKWKLSHLCKETLYSDLTTQDTGNATGPWFFHVQEPLKRRGKSKDLDTKASKLTNRQPTEMINELSKSWTNSNSAITFDTLFWSNKCHYRDTLSENYWVGGNFRDVINKSSSYQFNIIQGLGNLHGQSTTILTRTLWDKLIPLLGTLSSMQRGEATSSKSHDYEIAEQRSKPRQYSFRTHALH